MAIKKTYGKNSKRAGLNIDTDAIKKAVKNNSKKSQTVKFSGSKVVFLLLIVGILGGFFLTKYIVRKDCFVLNGQDEQVMFVGENYVDEGAKIVAFGKDDSEKVEIETNLKKNLDGSYTADEVGTYYMIYTVKNLKYGSIVKIQKIRLITFVEPSEGVVSDGE